MKQKGFAITAILYSILIIFVLLIVSFLKVLSNKSNAIIYNNNDISKYYEMDSSYSLCADLNKEYVTLYRGQYKITTPSYSGYLYLPANIRIKANDNSSIYVADQIVNFTSNDNPQYKLTDIKNNADYYYDGQNSCDLTSSAIVNVVTSASEVEIIELNNSLDNSGANAPVLVEGMIPVYYDATNDVWKKADEANKKRSYQWYNYDNKMWANAVMVTSNSRSKYMDAPAGTAIPMTDILAFYVWIPRYKYTIFNQNYKNAGFIADEQEIDIIFEAGTATTGNITCTTNNYGKQTCNNVVNGNTYTHPSFTFNGMELPGIWIGKFEMSCADPGYTYGYGDMDYECNNIRNKPNEIILSDQVLPVQYKQARLINSITYIKTENSIYSHLTKSIDYGAILYFMHSKYGRCTNGICSIPAENRSSSYLAGYAANTASYNTSDGQDASSTGNVYGIYDLASSTNVSTANNMRSSTSSTTYNLSGAGTVWNYYPNDKPANGEYDVYYANSDKYSSTSAILGDATGETQGWYSTYTWFSYTGSPLLIRAPGGDLFNTTYADDIDAAGTHYRNIVIIK